MFRGTPEQIPKSIVDGINTGHLDALMTLYEPEAAFAAQPGSLKHGLSGVRESLAGFIAMLSTDIHYGECGATSLSITGSGQGSTPDTFLPESQAMSRSSTWKTPRRRSGGRAASIVVSFSVGSARR